EVSLKDAGNDTTKKAHLVNLIAETISKINKAEDFTKQQDYIRRCSEIMKIEETGLNALVNKFIRERVSKQEYKKPGQAALEEIIQPDAAGEEDDTINLLFKDELQERAVVRALLEFGIKEWDDEKKVADYFFEELIEEDLFDNKQLYSLISIYKDW